jgi:hypothetical protein
MGIVDLGRGMEADSEPPIHFVASQVLLLSASSRSFTLGCT